MKKHSLQLMITLLLLATFNVSAQLPPAVDIASEMTIGWNIGNSLEVPGNETYWGNPRVSQTIIDAVYEAGFNTVRIPCAWDSYTNPGTTIIKANWLKRVQQVVDYCYKNNMYVIINAHWDGGWLENNVSEAMQETVNQKQHAYWTQIATFFKDYDEHLLFAGANEPHVNNNTEMDILMSYHQTFIDAVRATGGNNTSRTLVVQGPSTDIDKTKSYMKNMPTDVIEGRLMAEIHFYTPYQFCLMEKDENWGKMFYFWGEGNHSKTNTSRNATWGEESAVEALFKSMKTKFVDQGIPVILGEYGAMKRSGLTGQDLILHERSRQSYYRFVTGSAIRNGLIPVYWDNGYNGNNTMALFNRSTGEVWDQDALDALMEGVEEAETGVDHRDNTNTHLPTEFVMVTPNPVSGSAFMHFYLTKPAKLDIYIVNVLGQTMSTIKNQHMNSGFNRVAFNTAHLSSGIYFVKAVSHGRGLTQKITVIR